MNAPLVQSGLYAGTALVLTPPLLDVMAMRASHLAHGHTVAADQARFAVAGPVLARSARDYVCDGIDLLQRGSAERARARTKLVRAAALILAELERLDAETDAEDFL